MILSLSDAKEFILRNYIALSESVQKNNRAEITRISDAFYKFARQTFLFKCDDLLSDPAVSSIITELRSLLSRIEYDDEKKWAKKLLANAMVLDDFPDYNQYKFLLESEIKVVSAYLPNKPHRAIFIGSGPLPLSAIALSHMPGIALVHALDLISEARTIGQKVADYYLAPITCLVLNSFNFDYEDYSLVFVASLTTNKSALIKQIALTAKPNTLVVMRTTEDIRQIIYEPVDVKMLPQNFSFIYKTPISPHRINSTLFYIVQ